jgi:hypothetical protein
LVFQLFLKIVESVQAQTLVLADPSFCDLVNGNGIEIVQFVPSAPDWRHQIGPFQDAKMFAHGLPCHLEANAQFGQALTILFKKPIQQRATVGVSQRLKDRVCVHKEELYATQWLHVKKYAVASHRLAADRNSPAELFPNGRFCPKSTSPIDMPAAQLYRLQPIR